MCAAGGAPRPAVHAYAGASATQAVRTNHGRHDPDLRPNDPGAAAADHARPAPHDAGAALDHSGARTSRVTTARRPASATASARTTTSAADAASACATVPDSASVSSTDRPAAGANASSARPDA